MKLQHPRAVHLAGQPHARVGAAAVGAGFGERVAGVARQRRFDVVADARRLAVVRFVLLQDRVDRLVHRPQPVILPEYSKDL